MKEEHDTSYFESANVTAPHVVQGPGFPTFCIPGVHWLETYQNPTTSVSVT